MTDSVRRSSTLKSVTDSLDNTVLSLLVCPQDRKYLHYIPGCALYNPRLGIKYPIVDGIPILLSAEAVTVEDEEEKRLLESGIVTGT